MGGCSIFRGGIVLEKAYSLKLTTALQSGSWVPETSMRFHYWQPAPRWRPLSWLANPGNPAMSPHAEGEKQASVTLIKQWKERRGGTGEGRQPPGESKCSGETLHCIMLRLKHKQLLQYPKEQEHKESWDMRISNKPLTARKICASGC